MPAFTQDPEDQVFIAQSEIGQFQPDPNVGAVLCGFDINLSNYPPKPPPPPLPLETRNAKADE